MGTSAADVSTYPAESREFRFSCSFPFPEGAAGEAIGLLKVASPGLNVVWRDGHLAVGQDSGGDLDEVAEVLSGVMRRHDIRDVITLQASFEACGACSDKFGGAVAVVTAGGSVISDTGCLARELSQELEMARLARAYEAKYPGLVDEMLKKAEEALLARGTWHAF